MGLLSPSYKKLGELKDIEGIIDKMEIDSQPGKGSYSYWTMMEKAFPVLKTIGKDAVKPLIRALESKKLYVKRFYIGILLEIGDERAIEPIINTIEEIFTESQQGAFRDGLLDIFRTEIVEKNRIEFSRATDILIRTINSNIVLPVERKEIAEILAEIGDERAIEPLIRNWKSSAPDYKNKVEECFRILVRKLGDSALENILPALSDKNKHIRKMAVMSLAEFSDERVIEPITQLLNDKKGIVRQAARMTLEEIKSNKKQTTQLLNEIKGL